MIIHNFFSDVMISILDIFEHYIFDNKTYWFQTVVDDQPGPKTFFKDVQFNLGNRNWQIGNYKKAGQLEFPTGIFTLVSDETAFGKAANLLGHHRIWDVNEITCTHNKNTDIDIMLREEQAIIYLTVQINCESQLQANEVVHQIKRFLPPTKYEQFAPFSSFIQIPNYFFHTKYNNPNEHDIENLYVQYDGTTGEKNYFFLAHYKPMIRLNSVNAEISDNSSRSFPVLCDFNYLIQLPMWLFDTKDENTITRINLGLSMSDLKNSVVVDNNFLTTNDEPFQLNGVYYKVKTRYLVEYDSEYYKNKRITIPKPENDFSIQISKLYPKESTVVNWFGSYQFHRDQESKYIRDMLNALNQLHNTEVSNNKQSTEQRFNRYEYGVKTIETKVLGQEYYTTIINEKTKEDEIVIFTNENQDLIPDLDSPVIISIIQPISEDLINKKKIMEKNFNFIYQPNRPQERRIIR